MGNTMVINMDHNIKCCFRESNKNHVFPAKSKLWRKSLSSFIWLSFESHPAPDTACCRMEPK